MRQQAKNKYRELSNEEKDKKQENKQRLKNIKKIIVKEENQHKKFWSFFFAWYKLEQEAFLVDSILIKNHFIKLEKQLILTK